MRTNQSTKETAAVNAGPKGRTAGRAPSAELLTERGPDVAKARPAPRRRLGRRAPSLSALSLSRCAHREQLAIAGVVAAACRTARRWCHPALVLPSGFVWPIDDLVREARVRRDVVRCAAAPFPLFPPSWCSTRLEQWALA